MQARPNAVEAYAGLTRVYLKQKRVQQAHDTISKALAAVDYPPMHVAWGEVLFREGRLPEAESEWLNVVNSGHADARAHLGLARVSIASTQYNQAKAEVYKARALDPSDPEIHLFWLRYQKPPEQVAYLENYLAHENENTAEEQGHLRNYLEFLKASLKHPTHSCRLATEITSAEADLLPLTREGSNEIFGYGLV